MNTTKLIKQHERCIEVLDAIKAFNRRREINNETAAFCHRIGLSYSKFNHNIEIINASIQRLILIYTKEVEKLQPTKF